jgi:tetratricopeptide (TPR) repeat protein
MYTKRAFAYASKGQRELAIDDLTQAIRINPKYTDAYRLRGINHEELTHLEDALSDYAAAARMEPKNPLYRRMMGSIQSKMHNYDNAIAEYTDAIRLAPRESVGYRGRYVAYEQMRDYRSALADISKAIELAPDNVDYFAWRADTYERDGQLEKALSDYGEAIKRRPGTASSYAGAAACFDKCRELTTPIWILTKRYRLRPRIPDIGSAGRWLVQTRASARQQLWTTAKRFVLVQNTQAPITIVAFAWPSSGVSTTLLRTTWRLLRMIREIHRPKTIWRRTTLGQSHRCRRLLIQIHRSPR